MRRLGIVAIGLALMVGIVVGGMVGNPFGASSQRTSAAGAAASVTQQAEITLMADYLTSLEAAAGGEYAGGSIASAAIDTSTFPVGTSFTFNVTGMEVYNNTHCFRLARAIAWGSWEAVAGSEVCASGPSANQYFALHSGPLTLPSGENIYVFQWKHVSGTGSVALGKVHVLAQWTEPYAVGGFAELPAVAGTGTSGMGGATYAVLAGAAAGVLAFAVLATLSIRRGRGRGRPV
jgi:hypothetical protein